VGWEGVGTAFPHIFTRTVPRRGFTFVQGLDIVNLIKIPLIYIFFIFLFEWSWCFVWGGQAQLGSGLLFTLVTLLEDVGSK